MTDAPLPPHQSAESDPSAESKLKKVTQALLLEQQVRKKSARKNEIGFHITNDTFRLIPYKQCYLWSLHLDRVKVTHASGVSHVDNDSSFIQWFAGFIKRTVRSSEFRKGSEQTWATVHDVSKADCSPDDQKRWGEWLDTYAVMVLFGLRTASVSVVCGLIETRHFKGRIKCCYHKWPIPMRMLYTCFKNWKSIHGLKKRQLYSGVQICAAFLWLHWCLLRSFLYGYQQRHPLRLFHKIRI